MQALTAYQLSELWEWGQNKHPVDRALGLLTLAHPDLQPEQIAALTIGQRNARLLTLREATLGPTLNGYAECSQCGEKLEFAVEVAAIRLPEPQAAEFTVTIEEYDLHCRLPNSADLAAIVGQHDVEAARQLLIDRCILHAQQGGNTVGQNDLPNQIIPVLADAITARDPMAEMRFELECPACGQVWSALFDIVSFFWNELGDRVKRLYYDVHQLAQAYGWSEAEILLMTSQRRQFYLDLITPRDD
ncbi:MAG TPA: hypothetical protein P5121_25110 [Caldilineaceae bacterium]|nr:hypothetical protein [Caldilineaceae bacterium]